jgi:hypothetical protein
MNGRGNETNVAASYGANQIRPPSAAYLDNNASSSRNALSGTATPPGALAELKLKAKESILAKKAQTIRSSSQDAAVHVNGTDLSDAINGETRTQSDKSEPLVQTAQHYPPFPEGGSIEPAKPRLNLSSGRNSQNLPTEASRVYSPHAMVQGNLIPPKGDHSEGVKASSVEIEDLLAEGRAAAKRRPQIAPESSECGSGPEYSTQSILADNSKQPDQSGTQVSMKRSANQQISLNNSPQQSGTSAMEHNGTDAREEHGTQGPMPRQIPAKSSPQQILTAVITNQRNVGADGDTDMPGAPKPGELSCQTHPSQREKPLRYQEQMATHGASVLGGLYNEDDVEEWLAMTGFYDELYREKVLNRRRRMKAIEEERLQLLLEEQADQEQRSQSVRSHSVFATNTASISPFLARAPSVLPMHATRIDLSATKDPGLRIKDSALKNEKSLATAKPMENVVETGSLKRPNSPSAMQEEEVQPRKMVRTESNDHEAAPLPRITEKASSVSSLVHQKSPQSHTERFVEDQRPAGPRRERVVNSNNNSKKGYDQWTPDKSTIHGDRRRDSHDSRDVRSSDWDRRNNRSSINNGQRYSDYQDSDHRRARYAEQDRYRRDTRVEASPTKSGINLRVNDVRYFLIKSWNYENIETAQRECTWCTQTKNEDLFVDAFRNSTHVILIFSANNSHAFQGYARMQCLPGEPGVVDPTWRKYLHWPTTKPFKIRWITKGNSSYRVAGDLRNPLNDDSMVFVGRDGQEIPDYIGLELCEALDQDAKYRSNKLDH